MVLVLGFQVSGNAEPYTCYIYIYKYVERERVNKWYGRFSEMWCDLRKKNEKTTFQTIDISK